MKNGKSSYLKWIVLFLLVGQLQAQNGLDYPTIEKKTADYFSKKDWKSLIELGQDALTEGVDFYFLRYRMGVAYYEQKQYRSAIPHFQKALVFNEFDEVSKEYLYFSYLFSERFSEAENVAKTFRKDTKKRLDIKPPSFLTTVITEGGIKSPNFDSLKTMTFAGVGLGHRLGSHATAFHNFSYVGQSVYYGQIKQVQYYLGVTVPLKNGLTVQPAFHLIDLNLASTNPYVNSFHRTDFLGSIQASKHFTFLDFGLNASFSNLYSRSQIQLGATATLYPLANNTASLTLNAAWHKDSTVSSTIFQITGRYRMTPQLEVSAHYYKGNALNVNEMNGYLVNNSYDALKDRLGAMVRYSASKKLAIYVLGQSESRTESYYKVAYKNTTLAVGLQWNFL